MTPLATLLTAQLFQTSWARISSMVGIRIGSIFVTFSLEPEEPAAGSALESLNIFSEVYSRAESDRRKTCHARSSVSDSRALERER